MQGNIAGLTTTPIGGINLSNSNIGVSNILLPQTSTQNQAAQQLIGGAISPSLFVTTPLTSNNLGHHPVILNNIQTHMPIQPVSVSECLNVRAIGNFIYFISICSNLDTICHCGNINECFAFRPYFLHHISSALFSPALFFRFEFCEMIYFFLCRFQCLHFIVVIQRQDLYVLVSDNIIRHF